MEWKILKLDKTIETTLTTTEELETLLNDVSSSHTEGEMVAYFYYMEGLFNELEASYSASADMVRVMANEDHYERFLTEVSGSVA
jgi:hypothetical protein